MTQPIDVRDNRFTFANADDFGMDGAFAGIRAAKLETVQDGVAAMLHKFAHNILYTFPVTGTQRELFEAALTAGMYNHTYIAGVYAAASPEPESPRPTYYSNQLLQTLQEGAVAVALQPIADKPVRYAAVHSRCQQIASEHSSVRAALKALALDAQSAGRGDLYAEYVIGTVMADYTLCVALGVALLVPAPEMWPCPPEVWKPHRAQLASVEKASRVHAVRTTQ